MQDLTGRQVEVIADGIIYRGILKEIGEEEIHLESEGGWIVIPVERVAEINAVE